MSPQVLINVRVADAKACLANGKVGAAVKEAEAVLDGKGRVLLRPSGTEPLLRVMVEGEDGELVKRGAEGIAGVVGGGA